MNALNLAQAKRHAPNHIKILTNWKASQPCVGAARNVTRPNKAPSCRTCSFVDTFTSRCPYNGKTKLDAVCSLWTRNNP